MNILNKLTIKHLKMNKKRTVVTIIGVVLSTALMVGIGLLFSSVRDNSLKVMIKDRGPQHVIFENVKNDKLEIVEKNVKVKDVVYTKEIGYAPLEYSNNESKKHLYIMGANEKFLATLTVIEGRLPNNSNEIVIPEYMINNNDVKLKLNDEIELKIGTLQFSDETIDSIFTEKQTKKYKIVGIIDRGYTDEYSSRSFHTYTLDDKNNNNNINIFVKYKNPKDAFKLSDVIASNIGMEKVTGNNQSYFPGITTNTALLSLYGVSNYNNINSSMGLIMGIILSLISIGCIVVIYNSFAISVMERKKQFGLFSSIGTTRRQLQKTVFFEAIIVGVIGITLGIVSGFLGIGILLKIVNTLINDAFTIPLSLATYPLFIIVPIIFMIVVILVSAYLPAKKASKISPIELIRQNDDIKLKTKKLKTNKIIRKIFGIEGELSLKNIKRNKKKYRITIVSLFMSIVLFIAFSGVLHYAFGSMDDVSQLPEYNISISMLDDNKDDINKTINSFKNHEQVDKIITLEYVNYLTNDITIDNYNKKIQVKPDLVNNKVSTIIIGIDNKSYDNYKKEIGLKQDKPIIINRYKSTVYNDGNRYSENLKKFNKIPSVINLCHSENIENKEETMVCDKEISNFFVTDKELMGTENEIGSLESITIVVNEDMIKDYYTNTPDIEKRYSKFNYIKADEYNLLDKKLTEISKNNELKEFDYFNLTDDYKMANNMILVVKILFYGFIALVTLIGVTSVFNTINTSINLRRKEFSMLRSMGLTPKGFNKILYFESLFFGLKSLLYGIPVGVFITYLLNLSFGNISTQSFYFPIESILIATIGVFIIVLITMFYASNKIKRENILDSIREENI